MCIKVYVIKREYGITLSYTTIQLVQTVSFHCNGITNTHTQARPLTYYHYIVSMAKKERAPDFKLKIYQLNLLA